MRSPERSRGRTFRPLLAWAPFVLALVLGGCAPPDGVGGTGIELSREDPPPDGVGGTGILGPVTARDLGAMRFKVNGLEVGVDPSTKFTLNGEALMEAPLPELGSVVSVIAVLDAQGQQVAQQVDTLDLLILQGSEAFAANLARAAGARTASASASASASIELMGQALRVDSATRIVLPEGPPRSGRWRVAGIRRSDHSISATLIGPARPGDGVLLTAQALRDDEGGLRIGGVPVEWDGEFSAPAGRVVSVRGRMEGERLFADALAPVRPASAFGAARVLVAGLVEAAGAGGADVSLAGNAYTPAAAGALSRAPGTPVLVEARPSPAGGALVVTSVRPVVTLPSDSKAPARGESDAGATQDALPASSGAKQDSGATGANQSGSAAGREPVSQPSSQAVPSAKVEPVPAQSPAPVRVAPERAPATTVPSDRVVPAPLPVERSDVLTNVAPSTAPAPAAQPAPVQGAPTPVQVAPDRMPPAPPPVERGDVPTAIAPSAAPAPAVQPAPVPAAPAPVQVTPDRIPPAPPPVERSDVPAVVVPAPAPPVTERPAPAVPGPVPQTPVQPAPVQPAPVQPPPAPVQPPPAPERPPPAPQIVAPVPAAPPADVPATSPVRVQDVAPRG